ncbi:aldehyde dehydrogenase family protein, partial [Vibrio parahaemolyticus V-223/04]
ALHKLAITF